MTNFRPEWENINLIILPASATPKQYEAELRQMGKMSPDGPLDNCLFYISDDNDPNTVRLYVGATTAEMIRSETKDDDMTYVEAVQMRLMATLMESHLNHPEMIRAEDCVKYARTITRYQLNRAFRHIDHYSELPQQQLDKADLHALIRFIQGNL